MRFYRFLYYLLLLLFYHRGVNVRFDDFVVFIYHLMDEIDIRLLHSHLFVLAKLTLTVLNMQYLNNIIFYKN
jgi:hypothetical protein